MATPTTHTTLTTSFQLIGAGPGMITLEQGAVAKIHFATSAPLETADTHSFHRNSERSWTQVPAGLNAYAKKTDPAGTRVVVIAYTGS